MKSISRSVPPPSSMQRVELRTALEVRRKELEASIRGQLSALRDDHGPVEHAATLDDGGVSDTDVQGDLAMALVEMKQETLEQIDAALQRVDTGDYGRCVDCGDAIAAARLKALPFAVRCLECESDREEKSGGIRHAVRAHDWLAEARGGAR